MIPSEHVAAVVLVNKGVAFAGAATDAALAAVLPKYAQAMRASEVVGATSQGATRAAAAQPPKLLDSTMTGTWAGVVHTPGGDVRIQLRIAPRGDVQARIGARSDSGVARAGAVPGRLFLRISGDLEEANPAGMSREMRMYLDRHGTGFGGVITTRPPSTSGLDGQVSYWLEITRRP